MDGAEFFERMGSEFAAHADMARENAQRQADVERLLAKAEYEYLQMRRELAGLLPITAETLAADMAALRHMEENAAPLTASAAKAA